jgi:hypothetical protein
VISAEASGFLAQDKVLPDPSGNALFSERDRSGAASDRCSALLGTHQRADFWAVHAPEQG